MDAMPMPDGGMMSMAWMPMCGQSWLGAAASFLGMWTMMMAAMMLPSLVPMLWRYRQTVASAGPLSSGLLTVLVAGGYFLVWIVLGAAIYPMGAAAMAVIMRRPVPAPAVPTAIAVAVVAAGVLQLTRWKTRHLACCRASCCSEPIGRGDLAARAFKACTDGLRLGLHCAQCCAGLTVVLLVTEIMNVPAMVAVTGAVTLERLAPAGERIARVTGVIMIGAGFFLVLRARGLS